MDSKEESWTPIKFHYCFVANCTNNSTRTPHKSFFKVPFKNRKAWCEAAGRSDVPKSSIDICEDHIKVEQDIDNYIQWKLGKYHAKLKTEVPKKLLSMKLYKEVLNPNTSIALDVTQLPGCSKNMAFSEEKAVQCVASTKHCSVQAKILMVDRTVNTIIKRKKGLFPSVEDISTDEENLPSTQGSTVELSGQETNTDSTLTEIKEAHSLPKTFLTVVEENCYKYLGVPKNYFWSIEYIGNDTKTSKLHIITVLFKLKQGDPFYKIADLFSISERTLQRVFPKVLNMLSTIFSQFIYWPSKQDIKKNLPQSFRTNKDYSNTQSIIDCFEIEIEKPNKPIEQCATWSQYKNCNTIKFLISATPDGFINFISKGYGGRISDVKLVEVSGFIDIVKPNSTVLADRGFKHLESVLQKKSVKLLRPPSVITNQKMTKMEAIESKVIASLRIHIERVIRRVRLFKILKPHSTINNKLVNCVDDAVLLACGLINLQSPVIKNI